MQVVDFEGVNDTTLYTIKQTCAILGCHRNSLLNWTNTGKIKASFQKNTLKKVYRGKDIKKFWQDVL